MAAGAHGAHVAAGGAVGALARAALTAVLPGPALVATTVANVTGALALGLLLARTRDPRLRAGLGTGVLGSWTTFSAFAVDLDALLVDAPLLAVAHAVAVVGAGLAAAVLGQQLGAGSAGAAR